MLRDVVAVTSGSVERSGCRIGWQEFGAGERTVLQLVLVDDRWQILNALWAPVVAGGHA